MSFCKECRHTWPINFKFCPNCSIALILPTDETRLIMSLQDRILAANNSKELFFQLTEIMAEQLSARIFTLYLYDKISHKLVLRAATGIPEEHIDKLTYSLEESCDNNVTPWLFKAGKTIYFDDIKKVYYNSSSQSFVEADSDNPAYSGKYVDKYYSQIHKSYKDISNISFMGASLVVPGTQEKLGVIKAELKFSTNVSGEFETFNESELKIFEAIVPTIALAVQSASRMEDMRLLREGFERAIKVIKKTYLESLSVKDRLTYLHSMRVEAYASMLATSFFEQDSHEMALLKAGAGLHDLGKMNIPKEILQKNGKLTDEEMDKIRLHPEFGVSIYYKNFHDSIDDLSWLFIPLLHHVYRNSNKSYPVTLSAQKDWCHTFLSAFGIDPGRDIYNQFVSMKGRIYQNYNENVKFIYSARDMNDLNQRFSDLLKMVDLVRLCDALDALTYVRHYQFDPSKMNFAIETLIREGRDGFPGEILEVLHKNTSKLLNESERMEQD